MGFVSSRGAKMADAFGDDLFSVFDDEQTTSSKKPSSKTDPRFGYVLFYIKFGLKRYISRYFVIYMCLFPEPASARAS